MSMLPIFLLGAWGKSGASQSLSALTCNLGIMMVRIIQLFPPRTAGVSEVVHPKPREHTAQPVMSAL